MCIYNQHHLVVVVYILQTVLVVSFSSQLSLDTPVFRIFLRNRVGVTSTTRQLSFAWQNQRRHATQNTGQEATTWVKRKS